MQLTDYFESLADPVFAILDLALERPVAFTTLAASAAAAIVVLL